jgi:hypothetical protein
MGRCIRAMAESVSVVVIGYLLGSLVRVYRRGLWHGRGEMSDSAPVGIEGASSGPTGPRVHGSAEGGRLVAWAGIPGLSGQAVGSSHPRCGQSLT